MLVSDKDSICRLRRLQTDWRRKVEKHFIGQDWLNLIPEESIRDTTSLMKLWQCDSYKPQINGVRCICVWYEIVFWFSIKLSECRAFNLIATQCQSNRIQNTGCVDKKLVIWKVLIVLFWVGVEGYVCFMYNTLHIKCLSLRRVYVYWKWNWQQIL